MSRYSTWRSITALMVLLTVLPGCQESGVPLGRVSGVITVDGQPVEMATVSFYPENQGRASIGKTNEAGEYELSFSANRNGAIIGKHQVTVSTEFMAQESRTSTSYDDESGRQPSSGGGRSEMLPLKFTSAKETVLVADVAAGHNEIDFDLDSSNR